MKDSISNLITIVKNGSRSKKDSVTVPRSKFVEAVAAALARKGYVKPAKADKSGQSIEIGLIQGRITDAKRLSKPSKRLYKGYEEIHAVKQGYGSTFVSTPKGILSDDEARKEKVGGEILFQIW
ncbi:MAG TPA: 30S ribosomal protein S8 [Candidatus Paceibacterota bacterium]|jgi:Ribosomal protein S8